MIIAKNLTKSIGNKTILENINFSISPGEFITVFGPNGCGKTTLLSILAGLDCQNLGQVQYAETKTIRTGMVFQDVDNSMLPWSSVFNNIALALPSALTTNGQKNKAIDQILVQTGLSSYRDCLFSTLSGGQKQLTAIGRALIIRPDLLLMDEPFSALDYFTTLKMEKKLLDIWTKTKTAIVLVSHNVDEAVFLADKVIVMAKDPGRIKETVRVNLKRPRLLSLYKNKQFLKIRNQVLSLSGYEN